MSSCLNVPDQQAMEEGVSSTTTPLLRNKAEIPAPGCPMRLTPLIGVGAVLSALAVFWHVAVPTKSESNLAAFHTPDFGQARTWNWSVDDLDGGVNLTSIPGIGRHWYLEPHGVDTGLCPGFDWQRHSFIPLPAPEELRGALLVPFAMVMSVLFKLMQSSLRDKIFKCIGFRWDIMGQQRQNRLLKSEENFQIDNCGDLEAKLQKVSDWKQKQEGVDLTQILSIAVCDKEGFVLVDVDDEKKLPEARGIIEKMEVEYPLQVKLKVHDDSLKQVQYHMKSLIKDTMPVRVKKDYQGKRVFAWCSLLLSLLGLHYAQVFGWTMTFYIYGGTLSCLGYWLCWIIQLRQFLYLVTASVCALKHPASMVIFVKQLDFMEQLLYAMSPEKYLLLVLGENSSSKMGHWAARMLFLIITYAFDYCAILALVCGNPPAPLAAMLFYYGTGGIIMDYLGAVRGNWTGTKVPTYALCESTKPVMCCIGTMTGMLLAAFTCWLPSICSSIHSCLACVCSKSACGCSSASHLGDSIGEGADMAGQVVGSSCNNCCSHCAISCHCTAILARVDSCLSASHVWWVKLLFSCHACGQCLGWGCGGCHSCWSQCLAWVCGACHSCCSISAGWASQIGGRCWACLVSCGSWASQSCGTCCGWASQIGGRCWACLVSCGSWASQTCGTCNGWVSATCHSCCSTSSGWASQISGRCWTAVTNFVHGVAQGKPLPLFATFCSGCSCFIGLCRRPCSRIVSGTSNVVSNVVSSAHSSLENTRGVVMVHEKGSVQVSLLWVNAPGQGADLDLYVTPPSGQEIYYGMKESRCGGVLDTDWQQTEGNAVENIAWMRNAPVGQYKVEVLNCSGGPPRKFQVRIVQDGAQRLAKEYNSSTVGKQKIQVVTFHHPR